MNYRLIFGTTLCLLGVLASFALTSRFGPQQESLADQRLTEMKRSINALLEELKVLESSVPKDDLDGVAEAIARNQARSTQLQGQISAIQTTLKGIPPSISGGLFRSGFSWNKDATLAAITTLQTVVAEMNRDSSEASSSVNRVSVVVLDINRRTTEINSRVAAELKKMDDKVVPLSETEKLLNLWWMPLLFAVATTIGGITIIWFGWRKDRGSLEDLRIKTNGLATVTSISAPAPKITAEQTPTG